MGTQLKWQFDESLSDSGQPSGDPGRRSAAAVFWITAVTLTAVVIGGWLFIQRQSERRAAELADSAQAVVDLLSAAVAGGDGELYKAVHENNPALFAAQLQGQNLDFFRSAPEITQADQEGLILRANARWHEDGETYQRVLFFAPQGGHYKLAASDPDYWGASRRLQQLWGQLHYFEVDEPAAAEIAARIGAAISAMCQTRCIADRLPLIVDLRSDYAESPTTDRFALPSPRLLGLDEDGRPSERFYRALEAGLAGHLAPAVVRFAVPPEQEQEFAYAAAAAEFNGQQDHVRVELIEVDSLEAIAAEGLQVDGAAFVPSLEMIAGGGVRDLTPYLEGDPDFNEFDYYEQIWQGTFWEGRQWFVPQAAHMRLLFFHRDAYQNLNHEQPLLGWTWAEMASDAQKLTSANIVTGRSLVWGYLDKSLDTLFAYAYGHQGICRSQDSQPCPAPLAPQDLSAALDWYAGMSAQADFMPDVSQLTDEGREHLLINSLFKAAIWVDEPIYFEHRTAMFPLGILPFPGSEQRGSSTPLWVTGSYISGQSEQPLATWQWLSFLSSWPPLPSQRLIPGRPSVAADMRYWTGLPRTLAAPMRAAFALARPVLMADRGAFDWEIVGDVLAGRLSSEEAAQRAGTLAWFAGR